jgi:hypothetical protein
LQILPTDATGKNIFFLTDFSLAEKDFDWKQCVDNCTDSSRSIVDKTCGFTARVKVITPECTSRLCIAPCRSLAVKNFPNSLKTVLVETIEL